MIILITLIVILIALLTGWILKTIKRPPNFPPGPKWWPYVGNTYQLRKLARDIGGQHLAFELWAQKYNSDIIGLKLGSEYVIVAFSYPHVRQIHTNEVFEGRPDNFFLRLRTMGTRMGITCTDGALWNEHRNFATRHLRQAGYGRLPMDLQIKNELVELLSIIEDYNGWPVWPGNFLAPSVINVLWALTAGKRIERHDERLQRLLELFQRRTKIFDICGGLLSQFPWLRYIAPEKTGYNLIKQFNQELHNFFMETINEHKNTYSDDKAKDDLIYAYIKEMKERENEVNHTFTDHQLTMTILDIFIAGAQTTSNTLDLALMMMVVRPDIQEKIQCEIDSKLSSKDFSVADSKIKLPFTEAFLMEVQRFFHIVPISGPRRALKDVKLGNYNIPKNTTVLIGLKSVLMDKNYWGDPECFRPERFLDDEIYTTISSEYFMPFGQGKRRCLGDSLARSCLHTFFVGILKNFKLKLGAKETIPSLNLIPGLTLSAKPYKISFLPR
ncbi:probable cytochrome P450 305a1 [Condylostylus longicornis]|uniref:probable cytochrome P450 305a1 n=1 Tax=Condylostylus longicornis TaxID=2530218 RepID=UPI00244DDA40|nr:probable cytochrome P450 305a1 [Condylostylus longicornis]